MGSASDLQRQIAETRGSIESRIVELRQIGRTQARRASRTALVALGAGAAVGVVLVGAFLVYRLTRPPTRSERLGRIIPGWLPIDPRGIRASVEKNLRRPIPPVRLYIGDRQVGERPDNRWEKLALRVASAAGTAAAGVLARRLLASLKPSRSQSRS